MKNLHTFTLMSLLAPPIFLLTTTAYTFLPCSPNTQLHNYKCYPSDCSLCPFAGCIFDPKNAKFDCLCENPGRYCEICNENQLFSSKIGCFEEIFCENGVGNLGVCECFDGYSGQNCDKCAKGFELFDEKCEIIIKCEVGFHKAKTNGKLICELNQCQNGVVWGEYCVE